VVAVVDALLAAGLRDRVVNVGSGTPWPVEEILDGIERRLGRSAARAVVEVPGSRTELSITRLRALVPEGIDFGFGPGYLSVLLDRYVAPVGGKLANRSVK
jgi:nucleoside-diphosphate-sugar epimerase